MTRPGGRIVPKLLRRGWRRGLSLRKRAAVSRRYGTVSFVRHAHSADPFPLPFRESFPSERKSIMQRHIRNQAILAIRRMEAAPYCSSCDVYFRPEESAKHCTRCGKDIRDERMASESIFQDLQPQFPSPMPSYEAFEKLRGVSPEALVGTKLALGTVAEAARKYWAWNTYSTRK